MQEIRKVQPRQLFINADGPRDGNPEDEAHCEVARSIVDEIDWNCEVQTRFLDHNLGCGKSVSSGIDWFFSHVSEGIILEDDTVPSRQFFKFCEINLSRYRDADHVYMISGTNLFQRNNVRSAYFASSVPAAWGWATWKKSWDLYDYELSEWKASRLRPKDFPSRNYVLRKYLSGCFDQVAAGEVDTWDYQWHYVGIKNSCIGIVPGNNLVSNIGVVGTHSRRRSSSHLLSVEGFKSEDIPEMQNLGPKPNLKYDLTFTIRKALPIVVKRALKRNFLGLLLRRALIRIFGHK